MPLQKRGRPRRTCSDTCRAKLSYRQRTSTVAVGPGETAERFGIDQLMTKPMHRRSLLTYIKSMTDPSVPDSDLRVLTADLIGRHLIPGTQDILDIYLTGGLPDVIEQSSGHVSLSALEEAYGPDFALIDIDNLGYAGIYTARLPRPDTDGDHE